MDKQNWKFDEDGATINAVSEVYVPWLGLSINTWFEIEEHQNWWTKRQEQAFREFLELTGNPMHELMNELRSVFIRESDSGKIEKTSYEEIYDSINWEDSSICIPQLYDSENRYVIMLPETKWKLVGSDFPLELEIVYTNGKIEVVREMTGLWNRIEWFDTYLKRKIT